MAMTVWVDYGIEGWSPYECGTPEECTAVIRNYGTAGNYRITADVTVVLPGACPACGSFAHDGWTNHQDCPEDWTQYSGFEARRQVQLANERVLNTVMSEQIDEVSS